MGEATQEQVKALANLIQLLTAELATMAAARQNWVANHKLNDLGIQAAIISADAETRIAAREIGQKEGL